MLASVGTKMGKPLIIREYDFYPYINDIVTSIDDGKNEDIIENEYVLMFRKITIQSMIYARFAIE
jgi:hypothetical protein